VAEQELLVRIVGDDRSLQQAFARSSRSAQQFETRSQTLGRNLSRAFGAAGVSLGISAGLAAAVRFSQAASDLNEEVSKSEKVFGDSADEVLAWSETTARAFGISQASALAASGTFGNLFRVVDIGTEDAANMSRELVQLAADLASFNNANIDDVLLAIRSGLIGEAEPLRRYGVLLSETRVQQEAMAASGKKSATELTNQEKALARYNIILNDTVPAQGDFADTSDELANQQRIAAAESAELAANIGQLLVPAMQIGAIATAGLAGGINDLVGSMSGFRASLRDTSAFDGWNAGVESAAAGISDFFLKIRDGIPFLDELKGKVQGTFDQTPFDTTLDDVRDESDRGSQGAITASNARVDAAAAAARAQAAKRQAEASAKRFAEFTKGLGLKLKKAGLTEPLGDDVAALQELERAIVAQIAREGRTFELENDLTDVRIQIARKREEIAQRAADAEDAADEKIKARAEARRNRRQSAQFEALGLTPEGDARTPGIGALRRRAQSLLRQISGTDLDTSKNRERIGAVLSTQFKDAGREVRDAILSMFNEISGALDGGAKSLEDAMQTSFRVVNTSDILSGLGLSEEETQKLRRRLSRLGPGGTTPRDAGAGGAFGVDPRGSGNVFVTGPVTVVANDPDEFGNKIARDRRRTTVGRTGPHAGTRIGGI
jgi:hypothetical protein